MISVNSFSGNDVKPFFDDLARLRLTVFREFPYLYDGSLDYEKEYLATYAKSAGTIFVLAFDEGKVVGASTGMPLSAVTDDVQQPFLDHGFDIEDIFYFGESVLLPDFRGQGLGVRFFEEREKQARKLGHSICTFCAVVRPDHHPRRPDNYTPLNSFWEKRGYKHHPQLTTSFRWQDLDEDQETPKPMSFWLRDLNLSR